MGINETLLGVIDELYAGALDPARASPTLDKIASMMGASGGLMYLVEDEHRMIYSATSNFDWGPPSNVDAEHAKKLMEYYRRIPLSSVVHVHSLWPVGEMLKTPYYENVLKRQDVMYGAACLFHRAPRIHGVMTLNRSKRTGPFDETNFRMLQVLAPHVRRAMQVSTELSAAARERETFAATLDSLSIGVILTDSKGKLLHLNRAAEQIVTSNDGLEIVQGRLVTEAHDEGRILEKLIGQAADKGDASSFQRGGICKVSRASGLPPWLLLVAPCSDAQARAFVPMLPACVILIRNPTRHDVSAARHLRQLFGLTGQESRVAIAIAEGQGLATVAEELGLSSLTVRNHLQRVFAKTGTSRQAELARFVGSFAI